MSNKEMRDGLQEDTSGVSDENKGIEEEINATMDKIIAPPETDEDEMDDLVNMSVCCMIFQRRYFIFKEIS